MDKNIQKDILQRLIENRQLMTLSDKNEIRESLWLIDQGYVRGEKDSKFQTGYVRLDDLTSEGVEYLEKLKGGSWYDIKKHFSDNWVKWFYLGLWSLFVFLLGKYL